MTLTLTSIRQPAPSEQFSNEIDLLEIKFSHYDTGSTVTREQFMIVLSNLVEVKLRATYYTSLHESALTSFEMDTGKSYDPVTANRAALSVEQCYCPPNYRGYSCESCEEGYYKVKGNGPGLFSCVPCNCNGHADTCDQDTGECLNCRDNTLGKKCEQCKTGYHLIDYGNGQTECRLCPCPGPTDANIFADSCMFDYTSNKVSYISL
jgi:laminin, alpha 3/5